MQDVILQQTRDYLVLKIPLQSIKKSRVEIDSEKIAIEDGLKAIEEERFTKPFNSAKEAVNFLRKL